MGETTTEHFDPRSGEAKKLNEYPYYTARPVETIDNGPAWNSYHVGVFEHNADGRETQIGSYQRNYSILQTFWWFRRGSRHFALFSPDYTATRVMEIFPGQGFKDIGGEEPESGGFCPVEFYVPDSRSPTYEEDSGPGKTITDWTDPTSFLPLGCEFSKDPETHKGFKAEKQYESGWIKYPPIHGFVAGCIWGDDSSWKIQYLDLSRIEEAIIQRDERFGNIELPRSVMLRDAIHVYGLPDTPRIHIAVSTEWDLNTGKMKPLGLPLWD